MVLWIFTALALKIVVVVGIGFSYSRTEPALMQAMKQPNFFIVAKEGTQI
jgi:hypothetical protein